MNKYEELKKQKGVIDNDIQEEKRRVHLEFCAKNRKMFIMLDIAVVFIVLFNFGAHALTNAMVMKEVRDDPTKEVTLYEMNPITANTGDYELHPEVKENMEKGTSELLVEYKGEIFFLLYWLTATFLYVGYRRNATNYKQLTILTMIIMWYFVLLGWDFFNDLGYWIGGVMF